MTGDFGMQLSIFQNPHKRGCYLSFAYYIQTHNPASHPYLQKQYISIYKCCLDPVFGKIIIQNYLILVYNLFSLSHSCGFTHVWLQLPFRTCTQYCFWEFGNFRQDYVRASVHFTFTKKLHMVRRIYRQFAKHNPSMVTFYSNLPIQH